MDGANKVRQLGLGADLQRLRRTSGMSTRSVAERLGVSRMAVNRTESGKRTTPPEEVIAMCALYGITGHERERLVRRASGGDRTSSWLATGPAFAEQLRSLIALETEAARIVDVSVTVVPGLLQTQGYMRAIMEGAPEGDWMVATRLGRQRLLSQQDAPTARFVIDEFVLRRLIGGAAVMREQLEALLRVSGEPNVTVQVIPATVGVHAGLDGSFVLLFFPERGPHTYIEARGNGLILTRAEEVSPFVDATRELEDRVLDENESLELIKKIKEELPGARAGVAEKQS